MFKVPALRRSRALAGMTGQSKRSSLSHQGRGENLNRQSVAPGIMGLIAQFGLNAQELVIFRCPVRARQ